MDDQGSLLDRARSAVENVSGGPAR